MQTLYFAHYWLQTIIALFCVPVMKLTGFRFGKAWRDNVFIHHVAANLWADGHPVGMCKFFNKYL